MKALTRVGQNRKKFLLGGRNFATNGESDPLNTATVFFRLHSLGGHAIRFPQPVSSPRRFSPIVGALFEGRSPATPAADRPFLF